MNFWTPANIREQMLAEVVPLQTKLSTRGPRQSRVFGRTTPYYPVKPYPLSGQSRNRVCGCPTECCLDSVRLAQLCRCMFAVASLSRIVRQRPKILLRR